MNIFKLIDEHYFEYKKQKIYIIFDVNDDVWFRAKDIGDILKYVNMNDALKQHVSLKNKTSYSKIKHTQQRRHNEQPHSIYINEAGLYSLVLSSNLKAATIFREWVLEIVLPSLRKYGYYKITNNKEIESKIFMNEINTLKKQNEKMKKELKKDKYPNGGVVYVIKYEENDIIAYRIGITYNLKSRNKVHNTHSIFKKEIIYYVESSCPIQLETNLRSLLYKYKVKNKKDFYNCELSEIKKAFRLSTKSIKCMNQNGGALLIDDIIKMRTNELKEIKKEIKKYGNKVKTFIDKLFSKKNIVELMKEVDKE